jgi:hypothetical protein
MVAEPLASGGRVTNEQITQIILDDINTIIDKAAGNRESSSAEISGHAIVDALSGSWRGLKASAAELWE